MVIFWKKIISNMVKGFLCWFGFVRCALRCIASQDLVLRAFELFDIPDSSSSDDDSDDDDDDDDDDDEKDTEDENVDGLNSGNGSC